MPINYKVMRTTILAIECTRMLKKKNCLKNNHPAGKIIIILNRVL